jgi:hypothetical protein
MTFGLPQRRLAIFLLRSGCSVSTISRQPFAPGKTALLRWVNHFLETGQYTTPRLGRRSRPGKILANHLDFLIDHLHSVDATLYRDEMQSLLIRFFGRLYSVSLICATLIRRGVTRKKLSLIAARRNDYERLVYSNFIREHVTASQVLCFDEARIDFSLRGAQLRTRPFSARARLASNDPRPVGIQLPLCHVARGCSLSGSFEGQRHHRADVPGGL